MTRTAPAPTIAAGVVSSARSPASRRSSRAVTRLDAQAERRRTARAAARAETRTRTSGPDGETPDTATTATNNESRGPGPSGRARAAHPRRAHHRNRHHRTRRQRDRHTSRAPAPRTSPTDSGRGVSPVLASVRRGGRRDREPRSASPESPCSSQRPHYFATVPRDTPTMAGHLLGQALGPDTAARRGMVPRSVT